MASLTFLTLKPTRLPSPPPTSTIPLNEQQQPPRQRRSKPTWLCPKRQQSNAQRGDIITFTIRVSNSGPNSATNVRSATFSCARLARFRRSARSVQQRHRRMDSWHSDNRGRANASGTRRQSAVRRIRRPPRRRSIDPNAGNNTASATETPKQAADLVIPRR